LFLLQTYAAQEGPYQAKAQAIYRELRRNVVDNVVKVGCLLETLCFSFYSNTVQIRNTNVPDMYGNNTMLSQARDEEGMTCFHTVFEHLFTSFLVKVTHSPDGQH
jgi:hypothetical protein